MEQGDQLISDPTHLIKYASDVSRDFLGIPFSAVHLGAETPRWNSKGYSSDPRGIKFSFKDVWVLLCQNVAIVIK